MPLGHKLLSFHQEPGRAPRIPPRHRRPGRARPGVRPLGDLGSTSAWAGEGQGSARL